MSFKPPTRAETGEALVGEQGYESVPPSSSVGVAVKGAAMFGLGERIQARRCQRAVMVGEGMQASRYYVWGYIHDT